MQIVAVVRVMVVVVGAHQIGQGNPVNPQWFHFGRRPIKIVFKGTVLLCVRRAVQLNGTHLFDFG